MIKNLKKFQNYFCRCRVIFDFWKHNSIYNACEVSNAATCLTKINQNLFVFSTYFNVMVLFVEEYTSFDVSPDLVKGKPKNSGWFCQWKEKGKKIF